MAGDHAHTRLRITERRSPRASFALALRTWRERFLDRWPDVAALGFDETFRPMWMFCLSYFEAGFRVDYLDVWQFGMDKS